MHYAPRTIAFVTELFHPPLHPDPAHVQRVHNQLFQTGNPPYQGFLVTPQGAGLSNPTSRPGGASMVAFLGDRFQFREEFSSLTVEEFALRARFVSELVAAQAGIDDRQTPEPEAHVLLEINTLVVRATVHQRCGRRFNRPDGCRLALAADDGHYPAHE